ncbi:MAG: Methylcobalamin:coenzyme M methyltransferase MtbA [Candidatus Methanohalarchaeum thermophilum]|uniref:Methylcobalamin:coenzyme M methyltransferase MtbA n=1 Tax=Methanohalarchaeum thermophilum TaxID=1903181 RepID=A0A1Q6DTY1_METT1|nr:MAG: Methylcobalamin:coenzyme M methyltransferase MtbA [Candidatus Methanohalarchaeum thermophilum]
MSGEMTSMERWKNLLEGNPIDRVAAGFDILGHTAIVNGYEALGDFYAKPKVSIGSQLKAKEMYGYDQPPIVISPGYGAGEWGSEVELPYRKAMGAPSVTESVVQNKKDLEELEVPDPSNAPYSDEFYRTVELAIEEDSYPLVTVWGGCVSSTAPMIVDMETFMKWMRTDPDLCEMALDKSAEFAIKTAEWLVDEFGADNWIPVDWLPTDANVLIDSDTFGELVVPRLKKVHQKVLDLGLPMWFTHWCSDHTQNIEAGHIDEIPMGDPGAVFFGPEVTMEEIVNRFGDSNIVIGNVDPPSFQNKPQEEVLKLLKDNIERGKDSPKGFIASCGCELPPRTPPVNTYAIVKAAREYGQY